MWLLVLILCCGSLAAAEVKARVVVPVSAVLSTFTVAASTPAAAPQYGPKMEAK